jgi:hypothetical protein
MARTRRAATARAFPRDGVAHPRRRVADHLTAYNCATHPKAMLWRTPLEALEALEALWATRGELLRRSPDHLARGPNT